MNYTLLAIDYYLQALETGIKEQEAHAMTENFIRNYCSGGNTSREEYFRIYETINRISKQLNK